MHKTTRHAAIRKQQRGINDAQIRLIETFGQFVEQKGNCALAYLPADKAAALRTALDRIDGVRIVCSDDGTLITVMHKTRRTNRGRSIPRRQR